MIRSLSGCASYFSKSWRYFFTNHVALTKELFTPKLVPPARISVCLDSFGERAVSFRASGLLFGKFLIGKPPDRIGYLQQIIRALDKDAAAQIAEPFEIEGVATTFRRCFTASHHRHRVGHRNIKDPHLARGGDIAGCADLLKSRRPGGQLKRTRVFEPQQAACKIRMTIALQVEHQRLIDARQPDSPGHTTACAIIDFPTEDVLVNSPGHAQNLYHRNGGCNLKHLDREALRGADSCRATARACSAFEIGIH